jgi:hypothetical protein
VNAPEIAIARTGRIAAEKVLRQSLLDLINAEHLLVGDQQFKNIVDEADAHYGWDGMRSWGRSHMPFNVEEKASQGIFLEGGAKTIPFERIEIDFSTALGGFTATMRGEDGHDDTFLPAAVVDASARGDQFVIRAYAQEQAEMLRQKVRDRRETIRVRYEKAEVHAATLLPHAKMLLMSINDHEGEIKPEQKPLYNELVIKGLATPVEGYPALTTLGGQVVRRIKGASMPDLAKHWGG